jgi:hypothetical protein
VAATQETGRYTAAQLEEDREKLKRIDAGLDNVGGGSRGGGGGEGVGRSATC